MDYLKIYNNIINNAKSRFLSGYTENHHIIPKCVGGSNDKSNLVKLTAKEHFICHLLLCEIYPNNIKLRFALWNMCNVKDKKQKRYKVTSNLYSKIREEYIKNVTGKNNPCYGKKRTDSVKQKISKSRIGKYNGEKNSFFGKHHSEKTKEILKIKSSEKKHSEQTKQKMSEKRKGKLWYHKQNGEQLRTTSDDHRILSEGWVAGRYNGKELLKKANEKRKLKYSEIEPKKPHAKKCMINGLIFNSAVEAAKHYNMPDSSVRDRLRNKNFTDWIWI